MKFFNKPKLFIVTGSNGAGKSTFKQSLLPEECKGLNIFDGDIFYTKKSLEFYRINKSSKESRKLAEDALEDEFLRLVDLHISQSENFAYEGHFTGNGAWKTPMLFKGAGFEIHLIFCGLDSVKKSLERVKTRVNKGGFHVRPLDIENNYYGNMQMLDANFRMFDSIELIDTSSTELRPICKLEFGIPVSAVSQDQIPKWLKAGLPVVFNLIENFRSGK